MSEIKEVAQPIAPGEKRFKDKHVIKKTPDANGNGDDVFNATNIKKVERFKERHGYDKPVDAVVHEEEEIEKLTRLFEAGDSSFDKVRHYQRVKQANKVFTHASRFGDTVLAAHARKSLQSLAQERVKAMGEEFAEEEVFEGHFLLWCLTEGEQLSELKKSTLASYVQKASTRLWGQGHETGKREGETEVARAALGWVSDRKSRESARNTLDDAKTDADIIARRKAVKKVVGIQRASNKLAKEETEQLDERAECAPVYHAYHANAKHILGRIGAALDTHKDQALTAKKWSKSEGKLIDKRDPMNIGPMHVSAMQAFLSNLEHMHDQFHRSEIREQREVLAEGENAASQYEYYHNHAKDLLKDLGHALDGHKSESKTRVSMNQGGEREEKKSSKHIHWGHVGELKAHVDHLRELHKAVTTGMPATLPPGGGPLRSPHHGDVPTSTYAR